MNWVILITAGLFEVVWATALKMSNGFRNPVADVVFAVGMALSVWLLAVAMRTIPMGKRGNARGCEGPLREKKGTMQIKWREQ